MINLITDNRHLEIIHDPDVMFDLRCSEYIHKIVKDPFIIKALETIDGVIDIDEETESVKNKYGVTSIRNISTGSKQIVLLCCNKGSAIEDYEIGLNVLKYLNSSEEVFNIKYTGYLPTFDKNDKILIDDVEAMGSTEICERLGEID